MKPLTPPRQAALLDKAELKMLDGSTRLRMAQPIDQKPQLILREEPRRSLRRETILLAVLTVLFTVMCWLVVSHFRLH